MRKIEKGERGSSESKRAHVENGKKPRLKEVHTLHCAARGQDGGAEQEPKPLSCRPLSPHKPVLTPHKDSSGHQQWASDVSLTEPQRPRF